MTQTLFALALLSSMLAAGCASSAGDATAPAPGAATPPATASPATPGPDVATTARPVDAATVTRWECGDKPVGVRMEGDVLVLEMDGATHRLKPARAASGARYEGQGQNEMGRIVFWNKGHEATLVIGERTFPPCAEQGEVEPEVAPSTLAGTEWVVEAFDFTPLVDDVQRPTLVFDRERGLAGTTSCNRYSAQVTVEGDVLKFGPARVTRMACEPELMKQEQRFLDVLGAVTKYEIRADGWLVLTARGGKSLAARPRKNEAPQPQP